MYLKNLEVPDIYPARFAGLVRKILTAHIPTGKLGNVVDSISRAKCVQIASGLARMDAIPGVSLVSKHSYRFIREQIAIRPRARLAAISVLILALALVAANRGVDELRSKKPEIKVNGQAILVAEARPIDEEARIDSEIGYKESPFDFKMPVQGYISQGYHGGHRAIDIASGRVGVPIVALGDGRIEFAGYLADGKGNVIIVDHGDGLKSLYAHMDKIMVGVGSQVDSSTALGTVGLTGRTTGAHVHLEIYDNGIAVDPEKVLPEAANPLGLVPKAQPSDG